MVAENMAFLRCHRGVANPHIRRFGKATAILCIAHLPARRPLQRATPVRRAGPDDCALSAGVPA